MALWIHTINIKQHLSEREDPEGVQVAARAIADELERNAEPANPVAFLACMGLHRYIKRLRRVKTLKGANGVLNDLYDYADHNHIWLGF